MHILLDSDYDTKGYPLFFSVCTPENTCSIVSQFISTLRKGNSLKSDCILPDRSMHRKKRVKKYHHIVLLLIAIVMVSAVVVQCARADPLPPDADFNPDCGGNQGSSGTVTVAFIDNSTGIIDSLCLGFWRRHNVNGKKSQ